MSEPSGDPAPRAADFTARAAWAGMAAAVAYAYWVVQMMLAEGADKSFIGFALVPLALAAVVISLPLVAAIRAGLLLRQRSRSHGPVAGPARTLALATLATLAFMALTFDFLVPKYRSAPYAIYEARGEPSRGFTTPWGARMIAVSFGSPSHTASPLAGRTLWVAKTELTRGERARLLGGPVPEAPLLPATGLDMAQVATLLDRANASARPGAPPPGGHFRLPGEWEIAGYSGDWWITGYPKSWYRCADGLAPAIGRSANGLGLRGTTDNAAELVMSVHPGEPLRHCVMLGGVAPHCGWGGPDAPTSTGRWKSVRVMACTGYEVDRVTGHPAVGLRLVYSLDEPARP